MRTLSVALMLCLLCCGTVTAAFTITEVCPDTWYKGEADEYLVITGTGRLTGVSISDGEGSARFPDGDRATGRTVIAQRAKAYRTVHGNYPDYEWYDSTPDVPDMIRTGTLKLANKGDEVILREDGQETSCITWPKDVVCREGRYISMKTRSGTPPAPPDDRPVPVFPPHLLQWRLRDGIHGTGCITGDDPEGHQPCRHRTAHQRL